MTAEEQPNGLTIPLDEFERYEGTVPAKHIYRETLQWVEDMQHHFNEARELGSLPEDQIAALEAVVAVMVANMNAKLRQMIRAHQKEAEQ